MVSNKIKFGSCCAVLFVFLLILSKGFSFSLPKIKPAGKTNRTCVKVESTKECRRCSSHEIKYLKACENTGNVEEIICKNPSKKYLESCPFAAKFEMIRFWVFEGCVASLALVSNVVVWWRRNALNVVKYQKLKRQISDAV